MVLPLGCNSGDIRHDACLQLVYEIYAVNTLYTKGAAKRIFYPSQFCFSVRLFSVLRGHSVFHPRHKGLRLRRIFYPRSYPLHYFLILILEKVFPFSMLSVKQGNYELHVFSVIYVSLEILYISSKR